MGEVKLNDAPEFTEQGSADRREQRYGQLVNLKYERGLSPTEVAELESLTVELADLDASYYEPILSRAQKDRPVPSTPTR
jgi:hypothetical protein